MAGKSNGASENLVGKIVWATAADNVAIVERSRRGILTDGIRVLCHARAGKNYKYAPVLCTEGELRLYWEPYWFTTDRAIGVPTVWQPRRHEFHQLLGMLDLRFPDDDREHPLYREVPPTASYGRIPRMLEVGGAS